MRAPNLLALLTLACPLAAHADGDAYQPPTVPGAVTVYRGGAADTASGVTVHRGSAVRPAYLAQAPAAPVDTVGGRSIWFVDRAEDELTSCRAINTFNVGQRRIRCTRGRLPD